MCADTQSRKRVLLARFIDDFRIIIAHTDEQLQRAHELRYEVFLRELNYDLGADQHLALEQDIFDGRALHCLIEHRESGLTAGYVRLVFPSDDPENLLPLIHSTGHLFTAPELHPLHLPEHQVCEISRLVISRHFRSRVVPAVENAEARLPTRQFSSDQRRTFSLIVIALFLCSHALVTLSERRHIFALMESSLPRLLSLSGFHFQRVSTMIDYCGTRGTFYIDNQQASQDMIGDLNELYQHIERQLNQQLRELPQAYFRNVRFATNHRDQARESAGHSSQAP
ncbi:PEP-CTERM/exosortase system-associated acyltransferase [Halomonas huangheensis]|uniref:PEP-CTERM/exosortase system-associated acyltransferase n=1 Tax=Halomonas huangheensis TaxID=1178482 RepID=UPI0009DBB608|nr:PEP-CTERM/exosortase system-associated acyltransferase [Halomonas huangheensis]